MTNRAGPLFEIPMAVIVLHPATRAQMEQRLATLEAQLVQLEGGLLHLLAQPAYRASTLVNARRDRVSVQEMHQRGVENAKRQLSAEAEELCIALSCSS